MSRNPVTYFNRNDSTDRGLFFKFIRKQHDNFYQTVKSGLEIIDRTYALEESSLSFPKRQENPKTLEENYNIVPLKKVDYLVKHRGLSTAILNDELFKGRIFNAFHIKDNGSKIGNIAFPKYDLQGNRKNYILYNKPYFDRREQKRKKFRLTLNKNDQYLFYSKPIANPKHIVFGESAIDLLSYHELHGTPETFYISFGGSIYPEKLAFFVQLTEPYFGNKNVTLISAMDNDSAGRQFDIRVFAALVNQCHPNVYIEHTFKQGNIRLTVHYVEAHRNRISQDKDTIESVMKSHFKHNDLAFDLIRPIGFSDKLVLECALDEITHTVQLPDKQKNPIGLVLETMGKLYLPVKFAIHKSQGKDWNDDLRESKKNNYIALSKVAPRRMRIGDKIELKDRKGPEGAKNQGTIVGIETSNVDCDFGLKHTYRIPITAIKKHYQKTQENAKTKGNRKKFNKNSTLSIS